jgi:TP901 family phage tail tape measure protein
MAKEFVIPSVFKAIDKISRPMQKMARGVDNFAKNAEVKIARAERKLNKFSKTAERVGRGAFVMGAAILTPLGLAVREAVNFEDKMADVAKVTGTQLGSQEFTKISNEVKALSVQLAITTEDAADLYANLAQGGVAVEDLNRVAQIAGKVGVAFGVTGNEAGEAFVKIQNAMGASIEETEALMDSLNYLGNVTASSSAELITFMKLGGAGVARAFDTSGEVLAGFGSTLIAMGQSSEQAATIMRRFSKQVLKDAELRKTFDSVGGGAEGMLKVIEEGMKLSGQAQDDYFRKFGEYGIAIQLMGKNFGTLQETVKNATDANLTAGSVLDEFANRSGTTAFKFAQAKAEFQAMVIEVGSALLPVLNDLIKSIAPIIKRVTEWMQANPQLVKTIAKVAAVVGGLSLAVSGIAFLFSGLTKVIYLAKGALWVYNAAVKTITIAQKAWNLAMTMNPIGLVIAGVAALGAVVYGLSKAFSSESRSARLRNEIQKEAAIRTADQVSEVNLLFEKLKRLNPESDAYTQTLKELEKVQPGIIEKYNLQAGALDNISRAQKDVIANIQKQAEAEVAAEMYKDAVRRRMEEERSGPGFLDQLLGGTVGAIIPGSAPIASNMFQQMDIDDARAEEQALLNIVTENEMQDIDPEQTRQQINQQWFGEMRKDINIKLQMPDGMNGTATDGNGNMIPVTSETN